MIDTSPEAVILADSAGIIRFWNASAADVFGYSEAEAVGRRLDLIIPEAQRARHWAGHLRVVQSGETRYGRELLAFAAVRKDSSRISVESHLGARQHQVWVAVALKSVAPRQHAP